MKTIIHEENGEKIAQVAGEEIIIGKVQDALDLMVDPNLERARMIIIEQKNILPEFFDLSTRIAGEILQKFVQYRVKLAITGDFSDASESLRAFIYESNRGNEIFFCASAEEAKIKLFAAK
jgi:hypothetical protein